MTNDTLSDGPGPDLADVIVPSMQRMFDRLIDRMDGLTAEEYLWEPVEGMWSAVQTDDGVHVSGAGVREIDPPPMTTIAWRLWHIAVDCFDDYTRRFEGDLADASAAWTRDPDEAISRLKEAWARYLDTITSRDFGSKLGSNWDIWAEQSVADMAMHASNELVHHGGEVALLRDLFRDTAS